MDGIELAGALAHTAGNAGSSADLGDCGALVLVGAVDKDLLLVGNLHDELAGASLTAGAAVGALLLVDHGGAVFADVKGVELAHLHTGTEAEAAILALQHIAAADLGGSQTVGHAAILKVLLGVQTAVAEHMGDHLVAGGSLHTHDGRDLGGTLRACGSACGDGRFAGQNGLGAAAAAGIAAAAAVGAGQGSLDLGQTGIHFHLKHLCRHSQDQAKYDGQCAQHDNGPHDSSKIHSLLPPYQIFRPLKPMNARAIRPAVTRAMGKPSKALGLSLETSNCSRIAANRKMASRKPKPPVIP